MNQRNDDVRSFEDKVAIACAGIEELPLTEKRVVVKHRLHQAQNAFIENPTSDNFIVLNVMMCGYQHVKKNLKVKDDEKTPQT